MAGISCFVCRHPKRKQIEAAIASGASLRDIGRPFGISKDSVATHKNVCLKESIHAAKQAQQVESGVSVLDRLAQGEQIIDTFLTEFLTKKLTADLTLKDALAEQRRQVELRAKIEGELDERSITVTAIPDWRELRSLLLDALSHHPQARQDVLRALEAYDANKSA